MCFEKRDSSLHFAVGEASEKNTVEHLLLVSLSGLRTNAIHMHAHLKAELAHATMPS